MTKKEEKISNTKTNQSNKKPRIPKINDLIEGTVIEIGRNEIYLDINGIATGIVRGPELEDELGEISNLKKQLKIDLKFSKEAKKLPIVLSKDEIIEIIKKLDNPKHKLIISLSY